MPIVHARKARQFMPMVYQYMPLGLPIYRSGIFQFLLRMIQLNEVSIFSRRIIIPLTNQQHLSQPAEK